MATTAVQGGIIGTLRGLAGLASGKALTRAALTGSVIAPSDVVVLSLAHSSWPGIFLLLQGALAAPALAAALLFVLCRDNSLRLRGASREAVGAES